MAVTCTPTALMSAATCYQCGIPPAMQRAVQVYLLCNFINGTTVTCTPQALITAALSAGFNRLQPTQLDAVMTFLLCAITNSGGGGGGGSVQEVIPYSGDGADPSLLPPPTNILDGAVTYSPDGLGPVYWWNPNTQVWG